MLNFVTYGTSSAKDKSGAYLFLPDGPAKSVPSLSPTVVVEKGPVMSRVTVQLQNVIHTVRLFNSPGEKYYYRYHLANYDHGSVA